jgi:hypothetical protein
MQRDGWELTKGGDVVSISGPVGTCDSVMVLSRGEPITGAAPMNGIRRWGVHKKLEEITGLRLGSLGGIDAEKATKEAPKPDRAQGKKDPAPRESAGA